MSPLYESPDEKITLHQILEATVGSVKLLKVVKETPNTLIAQSDVDYRGEKIRIQHRRNHILIDPMPDRINELLRLDPEELPNIKTHSQHTEVDLVIVRHIESQEIIAFGIRQVITTWHRDFGDAILTSTKVIKDQFTCDGQGYVEGVRSIATSDGHRTSYGINVPMTNEKLDKSFYVFDGFDNDVVKPLLSRIKFKPMTNTIIDKNTAEYIAPIKEAIAKAPYGQTKIRRAIAKATNFPDFIERVVGSARKDLIRTVAQAQPTAWLIANELYDETMPVDVIVRFLENIKDTNLPSVEDILWSNYATVFTVKDRRKMMSNYTKNRDEEVFANLTAMLAKCNTQGEKIVATKDVKHFAEAYDNILRVSHTRRIQKHIAAVQAESMLDKARSEWLQTPTGLAWQAEREEAERQRVAAFLEAERLRKEALREQHELRINRWDNLYPQLHNFSFTDIHENKYTTRVADSVEVLDEWSDNLGSNCIGKGSYDKHITEYSGVLIGVYKGGIETHNILYTAEVKIPDTAEQQPHLVQFRGHNNQQHENMEEFMDHLESLHIRI